MATKRRSWAKVATVLFALAGTCLLVHTFMRPLTEDEVQLNKLVEAHALVKKSGEVFKSLNEEADLNIQATEEAIA